MAGSTNLKTNGTGLKNNVNGLDVLNAIRNALPSNYANRIPEATKENLASYAKALRDYPVIMNKWVNVLVNKILVDYKISNSRCKDTTKL